MIDRPLKILLLGDYSNCHQTLAGGLRQLGCDVTVASDGTKWMQTGRDVDITRRPGKIGAFLHLQRLKRLLGGKLSGFDVVSVHDPLFASLRPGRTGRLYDILRKNNRGVFYTAMSTDLPFLDMLEAPDSPLRYSEWFVDGEPSRMYLDNPEKWQQWYNAELTAYSRRFFDEIDGAVSVLYEYQLGIQRRLAPDKVCYGGLPINVEDYEPVYIPDRIDRVKIFLGRDRTRKLMKGSDLLEEAARAVIARHPGKAALEIVENVPFDEFRARMRSSHVVLDQIYSYTPATSALMAMAYGLNVVSGGEDDYYDFIGEYENRPIINAPIDREALTSVLEHVVLNPQEIARRGRMSRAFVEKHNDSRVVASRFLEFWKNRLEC